MMSDPDKQVPESATTDESVDPTEAPQADRRPDEASQSAPEAESPEEPAEAEAGREDDGETEPTPEAEDAEAGEPVEGAEKAEAAEGAEEEEEEEVPSNPELRWYVLRVQTGRENGVKESIDRRVKLEGLDWYFGRIMVPTETVSEIRDGRKRVVNRRTYAGYIFVEMEMTDEAQHLVSETPGVAGFVGVDRRTRTKPAPMLQSDVDKMLNQVEKTAEEPKVDIKFRIGETVKVKEGPFENFDGVVEEINPAKGLVKVLVTIFGRPTSVELEYWQVESA